MQIAGDFHHTDLRLPHHGRARVVAPSTNSVVGWAGLVARPGFAGYHDGRRLAGNALYSPTSAQRCVVCGCCIVMKSLASRPKDMALLTTGIPPLGFRFSWIFFEPFTYHISLLSLPQTRYLQVRHLSSQDRRPGVFSLRSPIRIPPPYTLDLQGKTMVLGPQAYH